MENWRMAQIANTIARTGGGKTKLADFLPKIEKAAELDGQSKEEQIAILNAVAAGVNRKAS